MKKVLLMILDGYGEGPAGKGNAAKLADTPFLDELRKKYPTTLLKSDSKAVGLPKGTQGGSEVGHFTMGAGRMVWQSLEEINRSIKNGGLFKMPALKKAVSNAKKNDSKLHIMGMISDEGVHSDINHLFALLKFAKSQGLKKVYIHAITDGRDVPERSVKKYIRMIQKQGFGKIATIVGRYYSMDRDTNWNRTQKAYDLYTLGKGVAEKNAIKAIDNAYKRGIETDYYLDPILLDKEGLIEKKDSVIFFNYRTDRARQITKAFVKKTFKDFKPKKRVNPYFVCFGPYSKKAPVLFPTPIVKKNLGEIISNKNLKQLRIAETEKYAHVTYFFNSQLKDPFKKEKRILIPSPKCPSYADKPEMSAKKITKALLPELKKDYSLIVLNFANCDLVGHSGELKPAIKAVETVDKCAGKVIAKALKQGYDIILTADHGNIEKMLYKNGDPCPSHTLNPVICIYISNNPVGKSLRKGKTLGLRDIAPTILDILGVNKPKVMTGESLLK
jgi:2,3-bisphosphoglycerate-independent phosphoglycerate mutase